MEAEPEMFGAAVAAPEDAVRGSLAAASRVERRTWSSLPSDAVAAADHLVPASDGAVSGDRRSAAAGRAIVGGIALVQVIWWAGLAYLALRLFVP